MSRLLVACFAGMLLAACDSSVPDPVLGAALDDGLEKRLVTVYLQAEPGSGFFPTYVDRIVIAEPLNLVPKTRAEGKAIIQNTDTIIIGESCQQLRSNYSDLISCAEVDAVDFEYGETEATGVTDTEGFAALYLGSHEKYRLSVKSWATREDDKCYWGGSVTLEQTETTLAIPVLVFCE